MAARSSFRTILSTRSIPSTYQVRRLHLTEPANIHELRSSSNRASNGNNKNNSNSNKRPRFIALAPSDTDLRTSRDFTDSAELRTSWRDFGSTVDFAYLPTALDPDSPVDVPIAVPLLLESTYTQGENRMQEGSLDTMVNVQVAQGESIVDAVKQFFKDLSK